MSGSLDEWWGEKAGSCIIAAAIIGLILLATIIVGFLLSSGP